MSNIKYDTASIDIDADNSVSVTLDGNEVRIQTASDLDCYISPSELKAAYKILIELEKINEVQ